MLTISGHAISRYVSYPLPIFRENKGTGDANQSLLVNDLVNHGIKAQEQGLESFLVEEHGDICEKPSEGRENLSFIILCFFSIGLLKSSILKNKKFLCSVTCISKVIKLKKRTVELHT